MQPTLILTNSPFLRKPAGVDASRLILITCWSPKIALVASDLLGNCGVQYSYFVIPILTVFSSSLRLSETLAIFYITQSFILYSRNR
jgi:hypothetical protein